MAYVPIFHKVDKSSTLFEDMYTYFRWERLTNLHLSRTCELHSLVGKKWFEQIMDNSSYFESLEAKAKEKYREKLSCIGVSVQDDPYLLKNDARFANGKPPGHG